MRDAIGFEKWAGDIVDAFLKFQKEKGPFQEVIVDFYRSTNSTFLVTFDGRRDMNPDNVCRENGYSVEQSFPDDMKVDDLAELLMYKVRQAVALRYLFQEYRICKYGFIERE
ncbi:MAG: hypothetical protein ACREGC_04120 [Minisyncoccia bacterium]